MLAVCWQRAGSVLAACVTVCWRCGGLRAGGRVADLLVAAWPMVTAAAGMFEAKEMQKMLLQLLQSAGCSEELNCGC